MFNEYRDCRINDFIFVRRDNMNNQLKDDALNRVIREAIREFDKEKKKEQKKKVFRNTRLLMKHYKGLKDHVDNAIDDAGNLNINTEGLSSDELYILSIKRSKSKTIIMLAHIDIALELLKKSQYSNGTIERYEAFRKHFVDGWSYEDIQDQFHCSKNTPGR